MPKQLKKSMVQVIFTIEVVVSMRKWDDGLIYDMESKQDDVNFN